MPKMPPRPCTHARCSSMSIKGGKCKEHQPEPWQSSVGKTPTQRGYGYRWKKLRDSVLRRDSYLCQSCLSSGIITTATDVDHILNKKRGGTDSMSNLQSLCNPCHKKKTIEERKNGL